LRYNKFVIANRKDKDMSIHESGEMYLETVYILSQKSQSVRSIDVAEYMGFSRPSVSRAIGLLKKTVLL